jgi:hypothetical protein
VSHQIAAPRVRVCAYVFVLAGGGAAAGGSAAAAQARTLLLARPDWG